MRIKDANEQLTSILFMQVAAMSVSSLPYASFMVYLLLTRHMDKMPLQTAWEQLISDFVHLLTYIKYVCSAYVYLATSPIYRQQLMSRHKLFPTRFGVGDEFHTSMLMSMSLAEHAGAVPLMPISSSEITGKKQKHDLKAVWLYRAASQQDSINIVRDIINASQADEV